MTDQEGIWMLSTDYPEHEKLAAIAPFSQAIGLFVEWLQNEKGIHLAEWGPSEWDQRHELHYARTSTVDLLAEHFDIDQDKIEEEKRAMLDYMRALHEDE